MSNNVAYEQGAAVGSESEVIQALIQMIANLRSREPHQIDPHLPFNELGVDSLDAVSLIGDAERRFSITIDVAEIYDHPSPAALARCIVERINCHGC